MPLPSNLVREFGKNDFKVYYIDENTNEYFWKIRLIKNIEMNMN